MRGNHLAYAATQGMQNAEHTSYRKFACYTYIYWSFNLSNTAVKLRDKVSMPGDQYIWPTAQDIN